MEAALACHRFFFSFASRKLGGRKPGRERVEKEEREKRRELRKRGQKESQLSPRRWPTRPKNGNASRKIEALGNFRSRQRKLSMLLRSVPAHLRWVEHGE